MRCRAGNATQLGNLMLRKGSGSPRRVVACALDRPGFAVTEITDDGYLRLREVGAGRQHPLWVQFHEGQRIRVLTRAGVVPGVVIVKSTHLQRGRVANAPVTTLDDLWVDVGALRKQRCSARDRDVESGCARLPFGVAFRLRFCCGSTRRCARWLCGGGECGKRTSNQRRDDFSAHDVAKLWSRWI